MNSSLILLPFLAVIILNLPFRMLMKKAAFIVALLLSLFQVCVVLFPAIYALSNRLDIFGSFLNLNFTVDNLSRIMLLCIGIVLFVTILVRKYMLSDQKQLFSFVNILLLLQAGLNGAVMVKDIFSLYVFLEIIAVASFILISFNKELYSFEAAFKYLILSVVATVLMLAAISLLLLISGNTDFVSLSSAVKTSPNPLLIKLTIGIFLCACFIKAGLMPFHGWVPDAYAQAPASVSVLLAGIVTKTVGVYTLIRITTAIFGITTGIRSTLLIVGAISVVLAALAALTQKDFKRMLAYSSISQVGYIILGLGVGTPLGLAGAVFHLFNHTIFKSLLFVNSAAVESQADIRDIDNLSGLAKKMPFTATTSVIASLSAAGIPPLAGFWSKLIIILALWLSGAYFYAVVAVLASVLTLAYFLSLQRRVFFGKLKEDLSAVREVGFYLLFPSFILSVIILGVGIFFPYVINTFLLPLGNIFGG